MLTIALSCQRYHVNVIMSTLSCQCYHVNVIMSTLSCQRYHVNVIMSTLSCQRYPILSYSLTRVGAYDGLKHVNVKVTDDSTTIPVRRESSHEYD